MTRKINPILLMIMRKRREFDLGPVFIFYRKTVQRRHLLKKNPLFERVLQFKDQKLRRQDGFF